MQSDDDFSLAGDLDPADPKTPAAEPVAEKAARADSPTPRGDQDGHGASGPVTQTGEGEDIGFETDAILSDAPQSIGEYKIEHLIGAGGMGRVYKAEHRRMARVVALKTLAPERMLDEAAVQRFYSEVRAAARLLHPNIVTAFDAGEVNGMHYLAMEFVEGETLSQLVARRGPLPVGEAAQILRGAAQGLIRAHAAGIVHRDVKPSNIMVATDGTVKVLDLGLATIRADPLHRPTRRGRLVGTVQYIAPEQLDDPDAADARADIYSLGATLFFLLAGRSPYEGELLEQLRQHRDGPLPDLFAARRDVDLRLAHVFQQMMAKRPQDRYSSLTEMLEDLDGWQASAGNAGPREWLTGLTPTLATGDVPSTMGEPTTTTSPYTALGIDLGMLYLSAAVADPMGENALLDAGGPGAPLMRAAVASYEDRLTFGDAAMLYRIEHPQSLAHCLHLYLGQSRVDRKILDQQCPPEVLIGLMLRRLSTAAWDRQDRPSVTAVTIPSCYDQLHRRSIAQACQLAGFKSTRLIDRGLAAAHSQLDSRLAAAPVPIPSEVQHWVVASLTGLACEAIVVRHFDGRLHTLSISGTWLSSTLTWQRRMIDLVADQCRARHGIDPRDRLRDAARLQQACERGMNELLLREQVPLSFRSGGRTLSIPISRTMMAAAGETVLTKLLASIGQAIGDSGVAASEISRVLLIGSMTRLSAVRQSVEELVGHSPEMIPIDRRALAQGAAMAAAAELPGRGGIALPPRAAAPYDLGLLAYARAEPHPRTLPVIPRGSALPARTGRRLAPIRNKSQASITIVESAGGLERPWRSLGTHLLPVSQQEQGPLEALFEVDVDGLLTVRLRDTSSGETKRLPLLPTPMLTPEAVQRWSDWVERVTPRHP